MLKITNKEKFCKKVGYNNIKPCIEKLEFLEKHGIEKYLQEKHEYDFVLGSELLLKKAIEVFGDEEDLKLFNDIRERLSRKPGHLFIETGFKRRSQPIFVLAAMEGRRNILIDRYKFNNKKEELEAVRNFVKKHCKEKKGEIELWGKIKFYVYSSEWFDKKILIDCDGNIIGEVDRYSYSRAVMSI